MHTSFHRIHAQQPNGPSHSTPPHSLTAEMLPHRACPPNLQNRVFAPSQGPVVSLSMSLFLSHTHAHNARSNYAHAYGAPPPLHTKISPQTPRTRAPKACTPPPTHAALHPSSHAPCLLKQHPTTHAPHPTPPHTPPNPPPAGPVFTCSTPLPSHSRCLLAAVPKELNEDRLCYDESLHMEEWPWLGEYRKLLSLEPPHAKSACDNSFSRSSRLEGARVWGSSSKNVFLTKDT